MADTIGMDATTIPLPLVLLILGVAMLATAGFVSLRTIRQKFYEAAINSSNPEEPERPNISLKDLALPALISITGIILIFSQLFIPVGITS